MAKKVIGAAALLTALSACSGDTPESLQESLSGVTPTLAYVDDEHAVCAAESIVSTVGFEQLVADGHTSTLIAEDPSLVEKIVEQHDSPELRSGLTECLDVDALFRGHLSEVNSADLNCDTKFSAGTLLVDEFLDNRFDGEPDKALDITDTADHRDLLRPCLNEQTFASQFGIDLSTDLAPEITDALPTSLSALPCAGDKIVERFGAETLNAMGTTVEAAELDFGEFDEDEQTAIVEMIIGCSDVEAEKLAELGQDQPLFGTCAFDAVGNEWKNIVVTAALKDVPARNQEWLIEDAVATCSVDKAQELLGRDLTLTEKSVARQQSRLIFADAERAGFSNVSATPAMLDCAFFVAAGREGPEEMQALFDRLRWATPDAEGDRVLADFFGVLFDARRDCEGDSMFSLIEMYRVGLSIETIECVARDFGGAKRIADLQFEVFTNVDASYDDIDEYYLIFDGLIDSANECRTPEEAAAFTKYRTFLTTALGEDGEGSF